MENTNIRSDEKNKEVKREKLVDVFVVLVCMPSSKLFLLLVFKLLFIYLAFFLYVYSEEGGSNI